MTTALPADIPTDLAAALAERYTLRGLLGRGGMAAVYDTWDLKHQRAVAIKVLDPALAASIGADRFLKEIQIVAQMSHPHVLPLYESGTTAGFLYYVMPVLGGGSLRQRISTDQSIDAVGALRIASSVADALTYAHALGVFHRDIKPENILFSHGHPVVADFGIARAISSASAPNLTRTGIALGTPGYMSPEQAAGFSDLDGRTDVYSLAVVVYEMLTGEIPGRWPSEDSVRGGRFLEATATQRRKLDAAGPVLERALVRALAVQQEQRTATPAAFVQELHGTAAPRRKFRPDEIDAIVKRASEMELENPTAGAMTIGGVEAIAREVGIAPELIRAAADSVAGTARAVPLTPAPDLQHSHFVGGPQRLFFERIIPGELGEEDFPILLEEIRRVMQNPGQISQLGKSFSWVMVRTTSRREIEVVVTARAGVTRIIYSENLAPLIGRTYGGICGGAGAGGFAFLAPALAAGPGPLTLLASVPVWFGGMYFLARKVFQRNSATRAATATQLINRLESMAREFVKLPARLGR